MTEKDKSTPKTKVKEWIVFVKYVVSGAASVALQFGFLFLFVDLCRLDPTLSSTLAYLFATIFLYLMLYNWAFKSDNKHHVVATKYAFTSISMLGLNFYIFWLLNERHEIWYIYSQLIASTIVALVNYVINRLYTFT
jgi:putative flippase GtrA